jgi:hypothetical protein
MCIFLFIGAPCLTCVRHLATWALLPRAPQSDPAYLTSFRYLITMPIVDKVLGIFGKRFRLPMFILCNGLYGLLTV